MGQLLYRVGSGAKQEYKQKKEADFLGLPLLKSDERLVHRFVLLAKKIPNSS